MSLGRQLKSAAHRYRLEQFGRWPGSAVPRSKFVSSPPGPQQGPRGVRSTDRRTRLEAILLLAGEPLTLRRMAQLANLEDATEARTLLEQLRRVYEARGSAFQIEQLAGGYQLLTRDKLAPWVQGAAPQEEGLRLTPPALETLAVVAYRQPALRAEVEAIRGVQCGELLRQLMDRDLLRIVGRSEELGRPILYGTTRHFLRVIGLNGLDDLPRADELRREAECVRAQAPIAQVRENSENQREAEVDSASIPLADS